jgi:hypothetical protein
LGPVGTSGLEGLIRAEAFPRQRHAATFLELVLWTGDYLRFRLAARGSLPRAKPLPLAAATRLGRYETVSLGVAGGMGEV